MLRGNITARLEPWRCYDSSVIARCVTYLGGALERVPVDGDGVVRDLLDAARQPDAVLRVCNKTTNWH